MPVRHATAIWEGGLKDGKGKMNLRQFSGPYSFASRFENDQDSNPEELIAAAHAGCFSMALAGRLEKAGSKPERIETRADVHLDKGESGFGISRIVLNTSVKVPGMSKDEFLKQAEDAKINCPVSKALAAVNIELKATLE